MSKIRRARRLVLMGIAALSPVLSFLLAMADGKGTIG